MSKKFEFFDLPNKNKIHKIKTPNIGGIALILIILSNIFINDFNNDLNLIFITTCVVIFIGFLDDLKNLSVFKNYF